MNYRRITFKTWCREFRPVHILGSTEVLQLRLSKPRDRALFEAAGVGCVWTLVDVGTDCSRILNGIHRVNRIGFFVTRVPCPLDTNISVYY